jgi:hypothetical protein
MSDEIQRNILTEIRARHEQDQRWRNGPSMICPHAHDDRGWLLSEIEHLRARDEALWEAFGVLTTLAPKMEIDVSDPVGMALKIEATVRAALKEAKP